MLIQEGEEMKLLGKPIDAMVVFKAGSGNPRPYKFKTEENGEMVTYICQSGSSF